VESGIIYWIDALKASLGALFGFFAVVIYWKVRQNGDKAMNSFQLNEREIVQDYKVILYANAFLLAGFGFYILGSLGIVPVIIWKLAGSIHILVIMIVLIRWVKLFR